MVLAVVVDGQTMILGESAYQSGLGEAPDRYTLVRELCEDIRAGVSPYLRLHRVHAVLGLAPRGPAQVEELRFVESLFGVLLGAKGWDAEVRLQGVDCAAPEKVQQR